MKIEKMGKVIIHEDGDIELDGFSFNGEHNGIDLQRMTLLASESAITLLQNKIDELCSNNPVMH